MLKSKILILLVVPAATALTVCASVGEPKAEECKVSPGSVTPRGAHWYYRINRADKQRCWYLGTESTGASIQAGASLKATPNATPRKRNATAALPVAALQAAPTETSSAQNVPATMAPSEAVSFQPLPGMRAGRPDFVARWPGDLPNAQDVDQVEPAPISSSYAESRPVADIAQMPSRWPVIDNDHALRASAVESALGYFSAIGAVVMALLLLAGWAAKFVRKPDRGDAGLGMRYAEAVRRPGAPTDPADDLKTSLAELMRDLQRAGAASDLATTFVRPAAGTLHAAE